MVLIVGPSENRIRGIERVTQIDLTTSHRIVSGNFVKMDTVCAGIFQRKDGVTGQLTLHSEAVELSLRRIYVLRNMPQAGRWQWKRSTGSAQRTKVAARDHKRPARRI